MTSKSALEPISDKQPRSLQELAPRYAAGDVTWREVADETDASFGELLVELGRQGLQLPTCVAAKRPAQQALFDEMLARAAASRGDESRHQESTPSGRSTSYPLSEPETIGAAAALQLEAVTQTGLAPEPLGYDTSDLTACALEMAAAALSGRNRDAVAKEIEQVERRFGLSQSSARPDGA
jgi:hypothetical protein